MTGTAKTEEKEFVEIYNLHVVEIPTNVQVARLDKHDMVFKTKEGKFEAVARDIKERSATGQPVLVGTIAVETSEYLSALLTKQGVKHTVLNAKEHAREAEIIIDAGQPGAVTIATNMAGRGVDIKLGEGVKEVGGLYVLGTERHESRRIDNQLRGRSGRQGDPGETRFYLSGEDDLVRLFAGDRIKGIMEKFKIPDDQPMEAKILSRQIEGAQKKVEEQNFVMRKNVLKYDDVLNRHRGRIYEQRRQVLDGDDMSEQVKLWIDDLVEDTVNTFTEEQYCRGVGSRGADERARRALSDGDHRAGAARGSRRGHHARGAHRGVPDRCARRVRGEGGAVRLGADARARAVRDPPGRRRPLARAPREHGLSARGRAPRSMAQKDPLVEYTSEGERCSPSSDARFAARSCCTSSTPSSRRRTQRSSSRRTAGQNGGRTAGTSSTSTRTTQGAQAIAQAGGAAVAPAGGATQTIQASPHEKLGRNEPCWCGSGKKFKKCHGA